MPTFSIALIAALASLTDENVASEAANFKAAFGKESCEVYELFGVIKDHLDEHGYDIGTNGAQEIEMYNHSAGISYAYVQVKQKEI